LKTGKRLAEKIFAADVKDEDKQLKSYKNI